MRDTTQVSIPGNFTQKRPSSIGRNTILLPRSLGRKQCLVVMEKSGKRRLTCPTLKKEGLGVCGGGRGKVLRGLGEAGHRRRRRLWRACLGRIPKLLFQPHIPDYPRLRRSLGKIPNLPKAGFDRDFDFDSKFNFENRFRCQCRFRFGIRSRFEIGFRFTIEL